MALLEVNYRSNSLLRNIMFNVILPVENFNYGLKPLEKKENGGFKTLYLLHGLYGNYNEWLTHVDIKRLAERNNLAVVMPSGENSFYINNYNTNDLFEDFIGKELVECTRNMFPLSTKREDTFIGGLSMGGYGAIHNGLKYNDTFGYIVALSSALITDYADMLDNNNPNYFKTRRYVENIFGNVDNIKNGDLNPRYQIESLIKNKSNIPKMYMACGTEDNLLSVNRDYYNFLKDKNVDVTYNESSGEHSWEFWDKEIKEIINWLPLD